MPANSERKGLRGTAGLFCRGSCSKIERAGQTSAEPAHCANVQGLGIWESPHQATADCAPPPPVPRPSPGEECEEEESSETEEEHTGVPI
jgi:hypothetical protein